MIDPNNPLGLPPDMLADINRELEHEREIAAQKADEPYLRAAALLDLLVALARDRSA